MLNRQGIGSRTLHVLECNPQVCQGSSMVIFSQALDGSLQPESAEVENLSGSDGAAHEGSIGPAHLPSNLGLMA